MSKRIDTWMPLLVDKYLGDTTHLSTEQHGAYLLLLMTAWKRDGVLPSSEAQLSAICRMTPARWKANREVLLAFFTATEDGTGLTQKRLSQELATAKKVTEVRAKAGAKGAAERWQNDSKRMANASQNDAPIPLPIPEGDTSVSPGSGARTHEEPDLAGHEPTAAGIVCRALRAAGIANVNPGHPRLKALLAAGATEAEFVAFASKAKAASDPFAYVLGAVEGERKRAAASAGEMRQGPMPAAPAPTVPSDAAERTRAALDADAMTPEQKEAARQRAREIRRGNGGARAG